jgi:hypothetical protein
MRGVFSRVFSLMIVRLRINENDVRFGSVADIFPGTFRTGLRWADIGESEWASAGRGD